MSEERLKKRVPAGERNAQRWAHGVFFCCFGGAGLGLRGLDGLALAGVRRVATIAFRGFLNGHHFGFHDCSRWIYTKV